MCVYTTVSTEKSTFRSNQEKPNFWYSFQGISSCTCSKHETYYILYNANRNLYINI